MRIAIISDIHSNIHALDAVLADIEAKGVDSVYATGDLVGYLPYPNEVVNRIREKNIPSIRGNHDDVIGKGKHFSQEEVAEMDMLQQQGNASSVYTNNTISQENRRYLSELPDHLVIDLAGIKVRLVHGSLDRIDEYLYEEDDKLAQVAESFEEDVLVFGHTHIPFVKKINGKSFINAGSVGKPKHGNSKGAYVLLAHDDKGFKAEIVEVFYDLSIISKVIHSEPFITDSLIADLEKGGSK